MVNKKLEREDWVQAAKRALIAGGIEQVKIDRLATKMKITRGSFYWYFKSHGDLLDALLSDWQETNTGPLIEAIHTRGSPQEKFLALAAIWLEEKKFSPRYDSAVRDWARTSPKTARVVRDVDKKRVEAIKEIFLGFGYSEAEAFIRARITYFHQVGYYALHIHESRAERDKLLHLYFMVLTGKQL